MASTLTTFSAFIKDRFPDKKVADLTEADRPLYAMMKKDSSFSGEVQHIPLIYNNPQGLAASSLATAQTNATNLKGKKFLLEVGNYQASVSMGDRVIKAARSNAGAFLRNKEAEIAGLYSQVADVLSTYLYRNGGGAIGQIATGGIAGNVLTLTEPADAMNFEEGMSIVVSDADGSGAADAVRAGSATVTVVDREAGTVTVDDLAGITGEAALDYIFREGDFVGDTTTVLFKGLQNFIYSTSSSVPDLYGMVRTPDPTRLAGCRVATADLAGLSIEEKLTKLGNFMAGRYKVAIGSNHKIFMHPEDWSNLEVALGSRVRIGPDSSTKWGFMAISVVFGGTLVKIYPDRYCPRGTAFVLDMSHWTFHSMMDLIHAVNEDGMTILRAATTNDYEYRLVSYSAPCTDAPGYSGRVSV